MFYWQLFISFYIYCILKSLFAIYLLNLFIVLSLSYIICSIPALNWVLLWSRCPFKNIISELCLLIVSFSSSIYLFRYEIWFFWEFMVKSFWSNSDILSFRSRISTFSFLIVASFDWIASSMWEVSGWMIVVCWNLKS